MKEMKEANKSINIKLKSILYKYILNIYYSFKKVQNDIFNFI
jgi:hypothetical protein